MGTGTYRYEVSSTADMASAVQSGSVSATGASVAELPDGTYYWKVRATDSLGNVGNWSAVRSFTKDTVPPDSPTEILLNGGNPVTVSNQTSLVLTAKASATDAGEKARYFVSIGSGTVTGVGTVASDGGVRISGVNVASLADGMLDVAVRIEDSIGNVSGTGTSQVFKDAVPPSGSVSFLSGSITNAPVTSVRISVSEPSEYAITGSGIVESYTGTLTGTLTVPVTLSTDDGTKPVTVTFRDAGGSSSVPYPAQIILDTTAPSLLVTSHDDGALARGASLTLAGTAGDKNGIASVKVNGNVASGTDTWSRISAMAGGTNRFSVVATDRAGNITTRDLNIVRVPAKPSAYVSITGTNSANVTFVTDIASTGGIAYGTSSSNLDSGASESVSSTAHTFALTGLSEETRYYFRASGFVEGHE